MKKILLLLLSVAAFTTYHGNAQNKTYKIGDRGPAGGWIFYDKGNTEDGWQYLEVASENQSGDINHLIVWSDAKNYKFLKIESTGTGIGSGKSNTNKITSAQGDGRYPASVCAGYKGGGKTDWFLPSIDELNLIFINLKRDSVSDTKPDGIFGPEKILSEYWSSSEATKGKKEIIHMMAFAQKFDVTYAEDKSGITASMKSIALQVRCVRAF